MLRTLVYLILTVIGISLLRSVIGIVAKFLSGGTRTPGHAAQRAGGGGGNAPVGGVLRKCPVCGTFSSEAIAVKRVEGRQTVFYCSEACEKAARSAG